MIEHARDAEKRLLGYTFRDNAVIDDVRRLVAWEDFETDAHRKIWASVVSLHDDGKLVDVITVADLLFQRQQIEDVKYHYLAELLDAAPTAAKAMSDAEIVHDHGLSRRYQLVLYRLLQDAEKHVGPAAELLENAEREFFALMSAETKQRNGATTLAAGIGRAYDYIDECRARKGHITGVPTGYALLDEHTGGLQNSELIIVGARPSKGKTSFGLCVARNAAVDYGAPVFFASLEQRELELSLRLLSAEAGVELHLLRRGLVSDEQLRRIAESGNTLRAAKVFIDDAPGQNISTLAATARRLRRQGGIRLFILDYVTLVESEQRRQSSYERVSEISKRLKWLARELQIPILALAQLNRDVEKRADHKPMVSDLRESGNLEQDADTILLLHEPEEESSTTQIIIAKQRNGPVGQVTLRFEKQYTRFSDPEIAEPL